MRRRRYGWVSGVFVASLLTVMACAVEPLKKPDDELVTPVALESLETRFEQISWQHGLFEADDWRNKLPERSLGPCECTGQSCVEDWVGESFGCNVCVALRCPDQEPEHVCVAC